MTEQKTKGHTRQKPDRRDPGPRDKSRRDPGSSDRSPRDRSPHNPSLRETLRALHLGVPMAEGALCVLPLYCGARAASKYVLLQQALSRGTMTITEVSEAGSVPHLQAVNKGPWPVLIFDGEELVGAKQNRIANATILVSVGKTLLPVSCVEAGRWSRRPQSFDDGTYTSHPELRREKELQVRAAIMEEEPSPPPQPSPDAGASPDTGPPRGATSGASSGPPREPADVQAMRAMKFRSDQGAVWDEVARTQKVMGVESATSALTDTFEAGKDKLEKILQNLTMDSSKNGDRAFRTGRPVGVAVFVGGQFVCLDLLRPGKRFGLLYPKLLRGYALEALMRKARVKKSFDPESATLRLLAGLMEADTTEQSSADLGTDLRLEGKKLTGSGLVWEDELLQLSVFPKGEGGR